MTALSDYIQRKINATGVYIGKLEPKTKEINDDDDDTAHLDSEAPQVIKFKHASKSHKSIMVGKVLPPELGICHELFKEGGDEGGEEGEEAGEGADQGE